MRVLLGAFGDPGHSFPVIALGKELTRRGHQVLVQTWNKWEPDVEREGMQFVAAPEYHVFPTRNRPLKPYQAVVRAAGETRPVIHDFEPDIVVNDILTLAPALAAEIEGVPRATLIPHFYPPSDPNLPAYGLGAMPPSTAIGRAIWRGLSRPLGAGVERGRRELNETRRRLGLAPTSHAYAGMSRELSLVGTFPQLEYPRRWPAHVRVCGPLQWEPPSDPVDAPPGEDPLVLVAPSTSQDVDHRLLRAAVHGLADLPVRVLATFNGPPPDDPIQTPANARLVDWLSYSKTMPLADLVVCHGGHGTVARALSFGKPLVVVPAAGDMAENAARVQWAGAGLSVPMRLMGKTTLRWTVQRVLEQPRFAERARELARWANGNDGARTASDLIEKLLDESPAQSESSNASASS